MAGCTGHAVAGRHNCQRCKQGRKTCWIHQFTSATVREQFARLMIEGFDAGDRARLFATASAAMLPFVRGTDRPPLDQLPVAVLNRELQAAVVLIRYRQQETQP